MIANLPPYPSYKHSGVEWLAKTPAHWELARISRVARDGKDSFIDGDWVELPYITDSGVRLIQTGNVGVGTYREQGFRYIDPASFDELNCTEVLPGDILICRLADPVGRACLAPSLGVRMITSVDVCILKPSERFSAKFIVYLLSSNGYLDFVKSIARGSTRSRISRSMLGTIKIPIPPLPEQRAIARYLDHVDRRIQRYIDTKEKLIALLQEARQATIHRAVTRGLDPDVPLKPSGVDWLGDVPAHWEVRRAKFLYREVNERSSTGAEELMSVSHKTGVTPRKKTVTMFKAETNVGYKLCRPGDIVINTMWAYMAALGVARQVGLVSPSYNVYRPIDEDRLNQDYMEPLLRTETYRTEYLIRSTGITVSRLRLYPESFLDIPLLHPPIEEQRAIAAYLDKATAATDSAIDTARRQADLMHDYRASLIAHVVTGKLDVRAAAERITMETPQP